MRSAWRGFVLTAVAAFSLGASLAHADYAGAPRTFLWNPELNQLFDAAKFKKAPPYVVGFSNASISNAWRVAFLQGIEWAAAQHRDEIKRLIVTDANDDPTKQISDIQDLLNQDIDILVVSPATEDALDPVVGRAFKSGMPVILVDRKVKTPGNYVSFVTASDTALGRISAQWLVEKLGGSGNIVMLPGMAGTSPAERRIAAAREVFGQHPGIKVLAMEYTNWNPAQGKTVMSALIQRFGHKIGGVWCDSGLQGSGSLEAFIAAGYKPGEIPPHTGGDLNQMYQTVVKYKVPHIGIDYSPSMGIRAITVALDVLHGAGVPRRVEQNFQISISRGDETQSVKADVFDDQYARMDMPGELIMGNGLPGNYDPRTFKVDYPK